MKATILALALALMLTPYALAGDCPTPKPMSCDTLKRLADIRCPPDYDKVECNCGVCETCPPVVVCKDCPPPVAAPPPEIIYTDVPVPTPIPPRGYPLLRYAGEYVDGPGLGIGGGYRFKNGIDLVLTAKYRRGHESDINAYERYGSPACPKYRPISIPADNTNYGVGFDVTIPIGGK